MNLQSSRKELTQLSTDVIPTQTKMSRFVTNGEINLYKCLNELNRRASEQKLRNGNMKAGRGVKPLPNSNGIYYALGYTEGARLYFKYSGDNIIVLGESDKSTQNKVIEFLLKNY